MLLETLCLVPGGSTDVCNMVSPPWAPQNLREPVCTASCFKGFLLPFPSLLQIGGHHAVLPSMRPPPHIIRAVGMNQYSNCTQGYRFDSLFTDVEGGYTKRLVHLPTVTQVVSSRAGT